jgi:hypothetical protein
MIPAVKAVRDHSKLKGAQKAVLYTAATYTSKDGTGVFISKTKIAGIEHCSRETVNRAFKAAEANGEIEPTGRKGRGQIEYSFAPLIAMAEGVHQMDRSAKKVKPTTGHVGVQQQDTVRPEDGHDLSSNWTPPVQKMDTYRTSTYQPIQQQVEQATDHAEEPETPTALRFQRFKEQMAKTHGHTSPDGWETFGSSR